MWICYQVLECELNSVVLLILPLFSTVPLCLLANIITLLRYLVINELVGREIRIS